MAHSWIMSFPSEREAFERYAEIYPENCVLLIDTYDTMKSGLPHAIEVLSRLRKGEHGLLAVRIDSGDLEYLSKQVREELDRNGLEDVTVVVSSDLDEWIIKQLMDSGAPIDAWGVGTRLVTGHSHPALTGVYKISSIQKGGHHYPILKISNQSEKMTNPGIKNIMRFSDSQGMAITDLIFLEDEKDELMKKVAEKKPIKFNHPANNYDRFILREYETAEVLLHPVMESGIMLKGRPSLEEIRSYRKKQINSLDPTYRRLLNPHVYRVSLSDRMKNLKSGIIHELKEYYNCAG